jgi:germination protein M
MPQRPLAALTAVLALAACSGGDREGVETVATSTPTTTVDTVSHFTLYYLDGEHLRATPARLANAGPTPSEAVAALLANEAGRASEIPPGTALTHVVVADGTATVDLSREFESGGGSASMQARVAQVVYTLTQWPWISRVDFELDGDPVEAIGGEGVPAREVTRADLIDVLPPIFLDPPLETATSPLSVSGSASVYEGTVSFRLEADGETLASGFTTAAEGGPGRGDFHAQLEFDVDEPTEATLVAFERSAADNSETKVARSSVRLCPSGTTVPC